MYFPRCYAGGTVAVDYTYELGAVDYQVVGQAYQVSEAPGPYGCYIELMTGLGAGAEITSISKVCGVSVDSRVIWRDSGRGLTAGRWRKVDLQTYLTRAIT